MKHQRYEVTDHFKEQHSPHLDELLSLQCCCHCLEIIPTDMLSRHVYRIHHNPNSQKPRLPVPPRPPKPKVKKAPQVLVTCKVCLLLFKSQEKLDNCMKRHYDVLDLNKDCICPLCEAEMPKLSLTDHFKQAHWETGQTCCPECLDLINIEDEPGNLRRHIINTHHSAEPGHLCPGNPPTY